jgi:hypothetical protein
LVHSEFPKLAVHPHKHKESVVERMFTLQDPVTPTDEQMEAMEVEEEICATVIEKTKED